MVRDGPKRARWNGCSAAWASQLVQDLLPVLLQHAHRRGQIEAAGARPQRVSRGPRHSPAARPRARIAQAHRWERPSPVVSGRGRTGAPPHGWASGWVILVLRLRPVRPGESLLHIAAGLSREAVMVPVG